MQFNVRALSADHLVTQLIIEARDEADACRQTEARGLFPASIAPVRSTFLFSVKSRTNVGRFSLVLFSQELLALLQAGLSIVEGLEALLEKETGAGARPRLTGLLEALREGKRFSAALAEQPDLFPPLYIGII
jgi:general secretion pathway protein F